MTRWSPMIEIGEWAPDRPDLIGPDLSVCSNAIPEVQGYDFFPSEEEANRGALDAFCRGAFAGRARNGTDFLVAGTQAKLWVASTGNLSDETWLTGPYTCQKRWDFSIFGNDLIAVDFDDAPQRFIFGTSAEFADLNANAPRARHCAVVRDFLVLGNIVGRGTHVAIYGTAPDTIHWSGIGDAGSWPTAGTSPALAAQSDYQPLLDDGGEITDLVGGADYGLVFKERSIWRMDYVGGTQFFRLLPIENRRGCWIPGSAIRVGPLTYFISDQGVCVTDGANPSKQIGYGRIDRYLRGKLKASRLERVSAFAHPTRPIIGWAYIDTTGNSDRMNRALLYNYQTDRFSELTGLNWEWVVESVPGVTSLDAAPYLAGNLDTTYVSLNMDSIVGDASRQLAVFGADHELYTLSGDSSRVAVLLLGDLELHPGYITFLRSVRPQYRAYGSGSSILIFRRDTSFGSLEFTQGADEDGDGKYNVRVAARYVAPQIQIWGNFRGFHGLSADMQAQGRRVDV